MNKLTLGVLLCDSVDPERLHIDGDYPAIFTNLFRDHSPDGIEVSLRFYDVTTGQYPDQLHECDGYLTNGASASVYDVDPWIAKFANFVRQLHAEQVNLFAICFGHQMIAHAFGGRVEQSERGWGVGVHEITLTNHEPWMIPAAASFKIVCSHQDQVTKLPAGAKVLASTSHCPVSLFRYGALVGIQGHPEFSIAYGRALMESRAEVIPIETRNTASESFALKPDHTLLVLWILHYLAPS